MKFLFRFPVVIIASFLSFTSTAVAQLSYEEAQNLYGNVLSGKVSISNLTREEIVSLEALMNVQSGDVLEDELGFTFRDVERRCEVDVDSNLSIGCRSDVRIVERKCSAYASGSYLGYFSCRGSELRPIEQRCTFSLSNGDIDC